MSPYLRPPEHEARSIHFRPLRRDDFPLISQWFAAPHVEPWWREAHDANSLETRYGPCVDGADPTEVFVVEADAAAIGLIQWYRLDDNPSWKTPLADAGVPERAGGIDYLIGVQELIGRGLGTVMIDQFLQERWEQKPQIDAVVVSVHQDNRRSWRALEKVGFTRTWSGKIESDDPSDEGPSHVYVLDRPVASLNA